LHSAENNLSSIVVNVTVNYFRGFQMIRIATFDDVDNLAKLRIKLLNEAKRVLRIIIGMSMNKH